MQKLDALKEENASISEYAYLQLANHLKDGFAEEEKIVRLVVQMSGLLRHVHQRVQLLEQNMAVESDRADQAVKRADELQTRLNRHSKMRETWRRSKVAYSHYKFAKVMVELERVVDRIPPYDWCCAECEILECETDDASNVSNVSSVASQTIESRTDHVIKFQRKLYVISREHQRRLDRMSSPRSSSVRSEAVPEPESQPLPSEAPLFRGSAVRFEHDSA
jgi:muconolactone delta-isomerase